MMDTRTTLIYSPGICCNVTETQTQTQQQQQQALCDNSDNNKYDNNNKKYRQLFTVSDWLKFECKQFKSIVAASCKWKVKKV